MNGISLCPDRAPRQPPHEHVEYCWVHGRCKLHSSRRPLRPADAATERLELRKARDRGVARLARLKHLDPAPVWRDILQRDLEAEAAHPSDQDFRRNRPAIDLPALDPWIKNPCRVRRLGRESLPTQIGLNLGGHVLSGSVAGAVPDHEQPAFGRTVGQMHSSTPFSWTPPAFWSSISRCVPKSRISRK